MWQYLGPTRIEVILYLLCCRNHCRFLLSSYIFYSVPCNWSKGIRLSLKFCWPLWTICEFNIVKLIFFILLSSLYKSDWKIDEMHLYFGSSTQRQIMFLTNGVKAVIFKYSLRKYWPKLFFQLQERYIIILNNVNMYSCSDFLNQNWSPSCTYLQVCVLLITLMFLGINTNGNLRLRQEFDPMWYLFEFNFG